MIDRRDHRLRRPPDDLARDDLLDGERRRHHRVEGLLVVHPDERGVGVLEKSAVHDGDRDERRGDEPDVGDLLSLIPDIPHESAQTETEGQEVEEGLQERRDKADLPALPVDGEIPLPDADKAARERRIDRHSLSSLPVKRRKTSSSVAIRMVHVPLQNRSLISR